MVLLKILTLGHSCPGTRNQDRVEETSRPTSQLRTHFRSPKRGPTREAWHGSGGILSGAILSKKSIHHFWS